jgi:formate hydrogenlyase subunit 3/multisubunit Na+/H+ antiporter MnhD subunit
MDDASLLLATLWLYATGAVLAVVFSRSSKLCALFGSSFAIAAGIIGVFASAPFLFRAEPTTLRLSGEVLFGGGILVGFDPLTAFFLIPIFVLSAAAALYGRSYMEGFGKTRRLGGHWASFNVLIASMVVVVVARDALSFLFGWELMTLAAFLLVSFEHQIESTRRAGWIYLLASHVAFASLIAMFLLLSTKTASLSFSSFAEMPSQSLGSTRVVFALALLGFGTKAGFYPLHVWLPEAHAAAPSHVSAVMSGVLIKMGVYGLIRTLVMLRFTEGWWVLMAIGIIGGTIAIAIALYQRDMKRVLAYSSVENVGIIALGLGLGTFGLDAGDPRVASLAFTGALLHVWNHTLMKGLLFLGAGSVLHGAGTKDLDRLGGLMKRMPWTATMIVLGATAISALPPMNGFASEWLIYLGLVERGSRGQIDVGLLLTVGLLALLGAIACLCFVRLVGIALLGNPRSEGAEHAHESSPSMRAAMLALLSMSIVVAIAPAMVAGWISPVVSQLMGGRAQPLEAPLAEVGMMNAGMWTAIAVVSVALNTLIKRRRVAAGSTWGCGYPAATSRIQYVARSFSELFAEHLLPRPFRARLRLERTDRLFGPGLSLEANDVDPLTRGAYEPFLSRWADRLSRLRWMQQGSLHLYVVYIMAIAIVGVAWLSLRGIGQP